jgi:fatty-acyl-CoA synthase
MGASEWVAGWARIKPDEPAIVFEGTPRSWRDLDVRASWIGDALAGAGVRSGDWVACLIGNRTEYVEAFIGALRAGVIFVPLNTLATLAELVTLIEDCGAGVLVTDEAHAETVAALATALTVLDIDGQLPPAGYAAHPGVPIVDGWLHTGDLAVRDSSGYFRIVDRKKDMVISGGLNVYPAEVENALMDLDGVLECAARDTIATC